MTIEHDLHRALRRKAAPPDFAERVVARLERSGRPPGRSQAGGRGIRQWLAAAAVLALTAAGGARYYEYRQAAAEAARVRAEIRLALQITSEALGVVQRKLEPRRSGGPSGPR